MFPSRTAMTVTGTHNPSSVKICVMPALDPNAPTPESRRARVVVVVAARRVVVAGVFTLNFGANVDVVRDIIISSVRRSVPREGAASP